MFSKYFLQTVSLYRALVGFEFDFFKQIAYAGFKLNELVKYVLPNLIVNQHLHDLSFSHAFSGQTKYVTNTKVWFRYY